MFRTFTRRALSRFSSAVANRLEGRIIKEVRSGQRRILSSQAAQACFSLRAVNHIAHLEDVEFRIFSQWGEDGIIEWLLQRIPAPSTFVEFGVENYEEANTRFLLEHRNWKGLVLDASPENIEDIKRNEIYWKYDVTAESHFITSENIDGIISGAGFSGDIGLLSIDIDGNDYWIWKSIGSISPVLVICEYNALFGNVYPVTIPYRPDFTRFRAHYSGLYYGASIMAFQHLAASKGYELIGTNRAGTNAFFLRNDCAGYIANSIDDRSARYSRVREARDEFGSLVFSSGLKRTSTIEHLPVVDLRSGETRKLSDFEQLFRDW